MRQLTQHPVSSEFQPSEIPSTSIKVMLTSRKRSKYGRTASSKPVKMSLFFVLKFSTHISCLSQSSSNLRMSPSSHHSMGDLVTRDWGEYFVPPDVHTHLFPTFHPSLCRNSPFSQIPTAKPRPNFFIFKDQVCFPVRKSWVPTTLSTSNRLDDTLKQSGVNSGWPVKDSLLNFHIVAGVKMLKTKIKDETLFSDRPLKILIQ